MSDYLAAPGRKLTLWTVTMRRGDGKETTEWLPTFRYVAYTPEEAVQFAARHSGIPDEELGGFLFTPSYEGET